MAGITIKGFKSIRLLDDFRPGPINVFIGQNGAGKSNFVSFFKLLANMVSGVGNLRSFTGIQGGASNLLFDGDVELMLSAYLHIKSEKGAIEYCFELSHASQDTFIFNDEKFRFITGGSQNVRTWQTLGAGHMESGMNSSNEADATVVSIRRFLQKLVVYQFHNTTFNSPIRNHKSDIKNGWFLEEDGRNLAAVLNELSINEPAIYHKVVAILSEIIPFFLDFVFEEEYGTIYLRWKERGSSKVFVATQASDGMLRAMALVTLLCLPPTRLPGVMFIDEPELGLHPSAINTICSLIHGVSEHCQVFIATQNADMLNNFDLKDIVVVTREGRESKFKRLEPEEYVEWLDDYTLAQLWEKNIIGGRP